MITLYAKISKYFMVLVGALLVGTIQNFFWKSLYIYIYIYIQNIYKGIIWIIHSQFPS